MSTETEQAVTPAEVTTPESKTETPANDGFVNLDEVTEETEGEDDEKPEGEKPEEAKPDEPAKKDGEEGEAKKKLSGAQRAKLRTERLLNENAELQRRLEEAERAKQAAPASDSDEKPPREEDFPDWFAWQRALTAFEAGKKAGEAIDKRLQSREDAERTQQQAKAARERADAHAERVEEARGTITDFDQVMEEMKGVNVRTDVLEEIMSSEKSALITYHLAQNPNELDALNSMSRTELARAMGRLEATVKLPEAKRATTAPAPLSRPKGGASPPSQEAALEAYLSKTYGDRRK